MKTEQRRGILHGKHSHKHGIFPQPNVSAWTNSKKEQEDAANSEEDQEDAVSSEEEQEDEVSSGEEQEDEGSYEDD